MSTDLKSRLFTVAGLWTAAQGDDAPLSRIGKRVAGDANFFSRLESPKVTVTVATLEKFAEFLSDAGNWSEGAVPKEVCEFAHTVGITSEACPLSPDSAAPNIDETQEAAE